MVFFVWASAVSFVAGTAVLLVLEFRARWRDRAARLLKRWADVWRPACVGESAAGVKANQPVTHAFAYRRVGAGVRPAPGAFERFPYNGDFRRQDARMTFLPFASS